MSEIELQPKPSLTQTAERAWNKLDKKAEKPESLLKRIEGVPAVRSTAEVGKEEDGDIIKRSQVG